MKELEGLRIFLQVFQNNEFKQSDISFHTFRNRKSEYTLNFRKQCNPKKKLTITYIQKKCYEFGLNFVSNCDALDRRVLKKTIPISGFMI